MNRLLQEIEREINGALWSDEDGEIRINTGQAAKEAAQLVLEHMEVWAVKRRYPTSTVVMFRKAHGLEDDDGPD